MDILGQSALVVAVTSFALGLSVAVRNLRNKLYLAFAGFATWVAIWALAFFMEQVWGGGSFYRFHLLCNAWLAPVSIAFVRLLVRIQSRFSRRMLELSTVLAVAATIALGLHLERVDWIKQIIYFAPGAVVIQVLQLMWIDRRLKRGIKLQPKIPTVGLVRRSLIYIGALLVLSTSTMDHVPMAGHVIPSLGNLGLCIYLYFISQAISQQRLLNFSALVSRFIALMLVSLTVCVIYWLLTGWTGRSSGLFFLNSWIASFAILITLEPLRSVARALIQRLRTPEQRRLEQALRDAEARLAGMVSPHALAESVLVMTEQALAPQYAVFFMLRSDGTVYERVRSVGPEPAAAPGQLRVKELLGDHLLVQACERLKQRGELPILLDQILESEIDRSASRAQREQLKTTVQALRALGCNLLIPLAPPSSHGEKERILALVTVLAQSPPEPWGNNWGILTIVYPYFEQAAATLRSMEIFARSREKERLAAIGEMAAGLAHEIRNPLGAIKGAAQFLDPSADRPESRFLKVIIEETDRLNRVVSQFLDYSKPWASETMPVDLSILTAKTVELLRPGSPGRVITEFQTFAPGAKVQASPEQLKQVLINLIQNSWKALDGTTAGGRVLIRVERGMAGEARLIVEDNGPGIRREHMDKLFIPFFTTSPSGTGLGLSICQKIVEAHQGRIEVASEEGRFTQFKITLPELTRTNASMGEIEA